MQATGQASTQSATPSQVFVTIVCGTVFFSEKALNSKTGVRGQVTGVRCESPKYKSFKVNWLSSWSEDFQPK